MNRGRQISASILLSLLALYALSACAQAGQYRWSGVERIVALSDPHGAYESLVETLHNADVIGDEQAWSGASTHLVITGDLLDRGPDSRKIMDLVMRLENESMQQGGMVHLTLGNHEVMNLVGDLRYVSADEYAAFSDEETAEERERWYQRYRAARVLDDGMEPDEIALRAGFDKDRPPGFFAHRSAFSSEGKYGRWLLSKPLLIVVNETAFVHGGLPPLIGQLGLEAANAKLKDQIDRYIRALEVLVRAQLIAPAENFYDHAARAETLAADTTLSADIQAAVQIILELNSASVHSADGPLWYRGTIGCSTLVEGDVLAQALGALGVERVAIGHTPTVNRQILQRHKGQVIEIDTGMLRSSYRGSGNALIIEGDNLSVVSQAGTETLSVAMQPRRVGARSQALGAKALEELLATADIAAVRLDAAGRTVVELSADGGPVMARFVPQSRSNGVNTELAAYRLDRLLGLDMVPVTVTRSIDGKQGTLQFLPQNTRDETFRAANGQGNGGWCPLRRQWDSMYIFDALVHNEGRPPTSMNYSTDNWQLLLTGHENSFGTKRGKPKYLSEVELQLGNAWRAALTSISDETLTENLSDVLSKRQISALGKRRDLLLREAAE